MRGTFLPAFPIDSVQLVCQSPRAATPAVQDSILSEENLVSQYFASWNRIDVWLRQLDRIHRVA